MADRTAFAILLLAAAASGGAAAPLHRAAAPAARTAHHAAPSVVGRYRLRAGPDTASELALLPDGRFQFALAEGALDLQAEGRWTSDGRTVILNTEPRPTPPVFAPGAVARSDAAPLTIKVTNAEGRGLALVDLRLGFADGHVEEGYTQDEGWHLDAGDPQGVRWVELSVRMYDLPWQRFPLDPAAGNDFTFVLTPNDLGVQDFRDTPLAITPAGLEMIGPGGTGLFVRQR